MSKRHSRSSYSEPKAATVPANTSAANPGARWLPNTSAPDLAIWLGLAVSILIVYWQVGHFEFINFDDRYVSESREVNAGLTPDSIQWAFTAVVSANWVPVTLLSHLLDGQLFRMQSGMHHLMNVLYHAMATLLLFITLRRATGELAASAFAAFVFALHPLHVESVAWVAERKDVLSGCFWFLSLYCYLLYTERPSRRRYLATLATFALGLLSKPMLVTFPFALLLLDVWPLRRFQWPKVLWEKLPLFALAAASSTVTYFVQRTHGAVDQTIPLATRIENSLIAYVTYVWQSIWPTQLAVFYPQQKSIPLWQPALSLAFLLCVTALVVAWRKRPYLAVGWFWYLGTLVPVIGLVQVGAQSRADRYMYIPMVGLAVMVAWGAVDAVTKWPRAKRPVVIAAAALCAVWMLSASAAAACWENSGTLFQHAIAVTGENWVAETHLGHYLMSTPGRAAEGIPHYEAALRIRPNDPEMENELGDCLTLSGRGAEAIPHFETALRGKPNDAEVRYNLALALSHVHREAEAIAQYEAALRLRPDNDAAHNNLGLLLVKSGHTDQAIPHFEAAVRLNPDFSSEYNLGFSLLSVPARESEAISHLENAQRLRPSADLARTIERLRQQ